jgi:hypothetical protein
VKEPEVTATAPRRGPREQAAVWFGLLGGPAAWTVHLMGSYLLVPYACGSGLIVLIHLLTLATEVVAVAAGVAAYRVVAAARRAPRLERGRAAGVERDAFLGVLGIFLSGLFFAVNLAEWLPTLLVDPCLTA